MSSGQNHVAKFRATGTRRTDLPNCDPDDLKLPPEGSALYEAPRTDYSSEEWAAFKRSIVEYGVIEPIEVCVIGDDRFVVNGRNRWTAMRECKDEILALGKEYRVDYVHVTQEKLAYEHSHVGNIRIEKTRAYYRERIADARGRKFSDERIAVMMGLTLEQVVSYGKPPRVKSATPRARKPKPKAAEIRRIVAAAGNVAGFPSVVLDVLRYVTGDAPTFPGLELLAPVSTDEHEDEDDSGDGYDNDDALDAGIDDETEMRAAAGGA